MQTCKNGKCHVLHLRREATLSPSLQAALSGSLKVFRTNRGVSPALHINNLQQHLRSYLYNADHLTSRRPTSRDRPRVDDVIPKRLGMTRVI